MKSELLAELETKAEALPTLPLDEEPLPTAHIIDAMAMVQTVKPGGAKTFGELADKYYDIIIISTTGGQWLQQGRCGFRQL